MSDWLDSMEFVYLVASYFPSETALDSKDWIERVKLLRAAIRSHFVAKGSDLFDSIINCTDLIAGKTYEIDLEKLEKLCGAER
jgi:hypothetical protein